MDATVSAFISVNLRFHTPQSGLAQPASGGYNHTQHMRKLPLFGVGLLLLTKAFGVGPVGEYLGFELNRQAAFSGWFRESLHMTLPVPYDTLFLSTNQDTVTNSAELLYHGLPGYLFRNNSWVNGSPTMTYDTLYESAGVSLKQKQAVGDTVAVFVERYRVPFTLDNWWLTGSAGTYPIDFGHNDTIDTVTIWADTSRVIAQEDVTTPYGTVPQCWRIRTSSRWCVVTPVSGIWTRDSMTLTTIEWYKDSLWAVKDSNHNDGQIRAKLLGFWLQAGNHIGSGARELLGLGMAGIAQTQPAFRNPHSMLRIAACPNPFQQSCVIRVPQSATPQLRNSSTPELRIVDAAGRTVFTCPASATIEWTPTGQPAGVYLLMLRQDGQARALGGVVYAP